MPCHTGSFSQVALVGPLSPIGSAQRLIEGGVTGGALYPSGHGTAEEAALYESLGRAYREQRHYQTQLRKGACLA